MLKYFLIPLSLLLSFNAFCQPVSTVDSLCMEYKAGILSQTRLSQAFQVKKNNKKETDKIHLLASRYMIDHYRLPEAIDYLRKIGSVNDSIDYQKKTLLAKCFILTNQYDSALLIYGDMLMNKTTASYDINNNTAFALIQLNRNNEALRYLLAAEKILFDSLQNSPNKSIHRCNESQIKANKLLVQQLPNQNTVYEIYDSLKASACGKDALIYLYYVASKVFTDKTRISAGLSEGINLATQVKNVFLFNLLMTEFLIKGSPTDYQSVYRNVRLLERTVTKDNVFQIYSSQFYISYYVENKQVDSANYYLQRLRQINLGFENKNKSVAPYSLEINTWTKRVESLSGQQKSYTKKSFLIIGIAMVIIIGSGFVYIKKQRK